MSGDSRGRTLPLGLPLAPEGTRIILPVLAVGLALCYVSSLAGSLGLLAALFCVQFFRDPERTPQGDDTVLVSPADGTLIEITEEDEPDFIQGRCHRISVFMSVFDCHVNRSPLPGRVAYLHYKPGAFKAAMVPKSSELNERNSLGLVLQDGQTKILVRQIAGLIARRILCWAPLESTLQRGERFGLIQFGSRVDIFLPEGFELIAKEKQRCRAGETPLARFVGVQPGSGQDETSTTGTNAGEGE